MEHLKRMFVVKKKGRREDKVEEGQKQTQDADARAKSVCGELVRDTSRQRLSRGEILAKRSKDTPKQAGVQAATAKPKMHTSYLYHPAACSLA